MADREKSKAGDIRPSMPVGIVLERRELDNPWQNHAWHAVAVLPGAPVCPTPVRLEQGQGWARFHAATLDVELFPKETEGYRLNLSNDPPLLYLVLRPGETADALEIAPFLATVCPYEAQDYQDSGEDIVEGVPMPPEFIAWVQAFIDRHHVDQPFVKRKRGPKTPHGRDAMNGPPVARNKRFRHV